MNLAHVFSGLRQSKDILIPELFLLAIGTVLTALCIVCPALHPGEVRNLYGSVGVIEYADLWSTMDPLSCTVYTLGDLGCHQKYFRCFYICGSEMPVCIREFTLLATMTPGLLLAVLFGDRVPINRKTAILSVLMILVTVVEWFTKSDDAATDLNSVCAATAVVSGFGFVLLLQCILYYEARYLARRDAETGHP